MLGLAGATRHPAPACASAAGGHAKGGAVTGLTAAVRAQGRSNFCRHERFLGGVEHRRLRLQCQSSSRRDALQTLGTVTAASWLPWAPKAGAKQSVSRESGATNEVIDVVNGIRHKRLGGGDIIVSEMGLGTQRWGSTDFNGPNEELCHAFLDKAVLENGINLIDTAEQYPIPSDDKTNPEGLTEQIIGNWIAKEKGRREKVVISTKITGGANISRKNIFEDCEGSLQRLGTDYLDVYLLHWPARYTPQANWGQSLNYDYSQEQSPYYRNHASFTEIAEAMGALIAQGKIRGWGMCNDNAYGLAGSCAAAKMAGVPPPVSMQNDYSLIDRRAEENGVFEAGSPINENVGFMGYNLLAGGMLTGKYIDGPPPSTDNPDAATRKQTLANPRGRMDEYGWGITLYRYRTEAAQRAILAYTELAKANGMSLTELSLRWCRQRRGMTSALVGQTSMNQLEVDLKAFQAADGLSEELLWEIDRVHMRNRLPIFSSESTFSRRPRVGEIGERIP